MTTNYYFTYVSYSNKFKTNISNELVEGKKYIHTNFHTAKFPYGEISYGEISSRRYFLYDEISLRRIFLSRS